MCVKKYDLDDNMICGANLPKGEAHSCSLQHGKQNVTAGEKNHLNIFEDMYFFNTQQANGILQNEYYGKESLKHLLEQFFNIQQAKVTPCEKELVKINLSTV